ncbi:nonstructural protein [Microviridae sp.]|nr:nonstructural protein [Microviridae sp.]
MLKNIYTIYDQKTREFLHPFISINEEVATRDFYNTLASVPTMQQHPKDFDLYYVGTFDTDDGNVSRSETVQFIIKGLDCVTLIQQESNADETTQSEPQVGNESPV